MPHLSEDKIMNLLNDALKEIAHEKETRTSREQSLVSTKIEEAILWRRTDLMRNTDTDFS